MKQKRYSCFYADYMQCCCRYWLCKRGNDVVGTLSKQIVNVAVGTLSRHIMITPVRTLSK